jgi:hypothetical protein
MSIKLISISKSPNSQRLKKRQELGICNGRNAISCEEKFKHDVWYVDYVSFCLDLKILWLTIRKIIVKEDISQHGQATIHAFKGMSNE